MWTPWLVLDINHWPITEVVLTSQEKEVIAQYAHKELSPKRFLAGSSKSACDEGYIDLYRFISWCSYNLVNLICFTAYVLRKIRNLTLCSGTYGLRMVGRTPLSTGASDVINSISAKEYSEAWNFLGCYEQTKRLDRLKTQSIQCVARGIEFTGLMASLSLNAPGTVSNELKQVILSLRLITFPVGFSCQEVFVPVLPG